MAGKYQAHVDLQNRNNSHTLIVESVGVDKDVLDVGTATGYVAQALAERGCRVTGIEIDPEAAKQAEGYCERVIVGNVERLDLEEELREESFDVIVFGDVLEHLTDPLATLKRFKPFVRLGGYVVASLPNIAHGSMRLALMQGKFQYRSLGLLDNTHLRFFTRESVEKMFSEAGFLVGDVQRTTVGIFETEIEVDRDAVTEEVLEAVRKDPESETYQFILMAYPSSDAGMEAVDPDQAEPLPEGIARRDRLIYELNRKVRNLEELQRQVRYRDGQLAEKEKQVAELSQELAERNLRLARNERELRRLNNRLEQAQRGN